MDMIAHHMPRDGFWQVPVIGRLAGRLISRSRHAGMMDEDTRDMLDKVLNYAAVAEQTIAAQQKRIVQLEALALTDGLTGLANRRAAEAFLDATLSDCRRHDESGVLALVDLDGFKAINDTLGHAAGDRVLKSVATLFKAHVRPGDMVARMGGDEFAVILTRCSFAQGYSRLVELQRLIDQVEVSPDHRHMRIGASLGIEPFDGTIARDALISAADHAMYRDKSHRTARVIAAAE